MATIKSGKLELGTFLKDKKIPDFKNALKQPIKLSARRAYCNTRGGGERIGERKTVMSRDSHDLNSNGDLNIDYLRGSNETYAAE